MSEVKMIETGIFKAPLILPKSLESKKEEFEQIILNAQRRVRRFAGKYGWKDLTDESFFDEVRIFDDKEKFDRFLLELQGMTIEEVLQSASMDSGTKIPKTFSGGLEKRILFAVSPDLFAMNFPEGIEEDSYEKLFAHEIAHRLHVRILDGDEDAMGAVWFFEGFAMYAVDQFSGKIPDLSKEEIREILESKKRGSYLKYNAVFRHFAKKSSLPELVKKACDEDFIEWLLALLK
ncbi:MAG: hypothetical protein K8T10_00925 [Candidatus Eremiobacteraeota bacterium]|nr:hypothetical protein [Candidatus Eremiobacteraeota bacterium]